MRRRISAAPPAAPAAQRPVSKLSPVCAVPDEGVDEAVDVAAVDELPPELGLFDGVVLAPE